ncbi:hypothetical protein V6N13_018570 [Hibiscus sabdariffa]|uniref:Uncharacterized protein n=1 Tax=Hibiscus sabdariffa TaxID=183260 RepID=A0ABR2ENC2_9ROSI
MVISGETSTGLHPKHCRRDAKAFGHIRRPRNKRVCDEARHGAVLLSVFFDHRCYLAFAHKFQLMHVLLEVSASRFVVVPAILERFEADKAVTDRYRLVGEVAGFSHLFAEVGGGRECDKLALGGKALA